MKKNLQYQAELNTRTKEVIVKIDEARQKHKAGSGPLELRRAVGMSSKRPMSCNKELLKLLKIF